MEPKPEERTSLFKNFTDDEYDHYHHLLAKRMTDVKGLNQEEEEQLDQLCLKLQRPMHYGRQ